MAQQALVESAALFGFLAHNGVFDRLIVEAVGLFLFLIENGLGARFN